MYCKICKDILSIREEKKGICEKCEKKKGIPK